MEDNKNQSDGNAAVIIYTTPTCVYCKMAKEFFQKNNVVYEERDVAADDAAREEALEKSGQLAVPVIDVKGEIVVGFNESRLRELLSIA